MSYKWNVTAAVVRRENGFSDHLGFGLFTRSILGSLYMIQQIGPINIVKETRVCSSNFNRKGELLCIGRGDKQIVIYDWAKNNLVDIFDSEHTDAVDDLQFVDTNDNILDILSTSHDGQIRRARILPTGELISSFLYKERRICPRLSVVPGSPFEFVVVDTRGNIFQMDLRCHLVGRAPDGRIEKSDGGYLPLYHVAHHPFSMEISIGGFDPYLRVLDKRKLTECVRKMYSKNNGPLTRITKCSYNYDGSEILVKYFTGQDLHLFANNENWTQRNYSISPRVGHRIYRDVCYFGPKSEFLACLEKDGISFFHKTTGCIVRRACIFKDDPSGIASQVQPHPSLPLIACPSYYKGVVILSPTKKFINDEMGF